MDIVDVPQVVSRTETYMLKGHKVSYRPPSCAELWDMFPLNLHWAFNEYSIFLWSYQLKLPLTYTVRRTYNKIHRYDNINKQEVAIWWTKPWNLWIVNYSPCKETCSKRPPWDIPWKPLCVSWPQYINGTTYMSKNILANHKILVPLLELTKPQPKRYGIYGRFHTDILFYICMGTLLTFTHNWSLFYMSSFLSKNK